MGARVQRNQDFFRGKSCRVCGQGQYHHLARPKAGEFEDFCKASSRERVYGVRGCVSFVSVTVSFVSVSVCERKKIKNE